jgi:hypothetical protein
MNILMMTNTYPPFVGGVAKSVESLNAQLRSNVRPSPMQPPLAEWIFGGAVSGVSAPAAGRGWSPECFPSSPVTC